VCIGWCTHSHSARRTCIWQILFSCFYFSHPGRVLLFTFPCCKAQLNSYARLRLFDVCIAAAVTSPKIPDSRPLPLPLPSSRQIHLELELDSQRDHGDGDGGITSLRSNNIRWQLGLGMTNSPQQQWQIAQVSVGYSSVSCRCEEIWGRSRTIVVNVVNGKRDYITPPLWKSHKKLYKSGSFRALFPRLSIGVFLIDNAIRWVGSGLEYHTIIYHKFKDLSKTHDPQF